MYDGLRLYSSGFLILRGWMKNKEIAINSKNLISESYHTGHLGVGKVEKKKTLSRWHILPYCICWVFKVQFLCSHYKRLLVFYTVQGVVSKWKPCHKYRLWEANGAHFGLRLSQASVERWHLIFKPSGACPSYVMFLLTKIVSFFKIFIQLNAITFSWTVYQNVSLHGDLEFY